MRDWTSIHVGSGSTNDRCSFMSESVTQMPNRLRISNGNRSIVCARTRKTSVFKKTFSTLSMEHLCPRYLQQVAVRECLRYYSPLAELIDIKKGEQCAKAHVMDQKQNLVCIIMDQHLFVLEDLCKKESSVS